MMKVLAFGVIAFRIIICVIVSGKLSYRSKSWKFARIFAATTKTPEFKNCWEISLNVKISKY